MQNSIQNVKTVRFGSWVLSVSTNDWSSWINLWGLKDAQLAVEKSIIEVVLDNAKMPPKVKINEALFTCNLYEINLENLQIIDWMATYASVDWTETTVTGEALWTGWLVDSIIKLANKNWDNSIATDVVVKTWATPLVLNTDYRLSVGSDGYTYIYPITAQAWVLTVDYKYTPTARKEQLYRDIIKTLATNRFKFVNVDEDWKEFGIEFYKWYNRAWINASFLADDTTDDAMSIPVEIKAYPVVGSQNLFRIFDEQDVS